MRSFISVDIEDEEVLSTLHDLTREVSNTDAKVNPVPRENLHITLKFLGDIDDTRVPEIKKIIKKYATDIEPFPLTLVGMGAFPSTKRPKVVWIGAENDQKLKDIANNISKDLERNGFRKDRHPYHSHVTLARIKWYTDQLKNVIATNKDTKVGEILVDNIKIKKSELTSEGPTYSTVEKIELTGS